MSTSSVEVRLGGLNIRVPMYSNHDSTAGLVEMVNAKLLQLEANSSKVNTQVFALQAAYEFARECAILRNDLADAEAQFIAALENLASRIDQFRGQVEVSAETGAR